MAWHCNKCNQSGEKFDGCSISECEMVYTTGDEPTAIAELRRRVAKANELSGGYDNKGNHVLGAFLAAVLQEYENVLKELEWTRGIVGTAYYEGAEDNDFNRELELEDRMKSGKWPERKYTWNTSNVKRLLDER
jgi:hypothetical protein